MRNFMTLIGIENKGRKGSDGEYHGRMMRLLKVSIDISTPSEYKWNYEKLRADDSKLASTLAGGMKITNLGLENGKLVGKAGSLERFSNGNNRYLQYLILSEIRLETGKILGYKLVDFNGVVKNYKLDDIISICDKYEKANKIPIINGIYVSKTEDRNAHIRSFPNSPFFKEIIGTKKSEAKSPKDMGISDTKRYNADNVKKLSDVYTPEQIEQLKIGRKNGVNIKIYSNPKLSAKQMEELRKGLEMGVSVRKYAYPEFKPECMKVYNYELKYGFDISGFLDPKFDLQQLAVLTMANSEGVDVRKIAKPEMGAGEMMQLAERMRIKTWRVSFMTDEKWKELEV